MNEIQQVSFDLMCKFIEICDQLDLEYFLVCGSALGAARHGGFIPWDDDIDVAMKRADYERFLQEAPALLPAHYALQNLHTNEAFPLLMTKMVDLHTTLIEENFRHLPIHHSIFLDIFPLDGYPKGKLAAAVLEGKKWLCNKLRCFAYIYGYKRFGLNRIMRYYESALQKYPCEGSDLLCNHGNWQGKLEYSPAKEYGQGAWKEFEGVSVRIPQRYEDYLTRKYGSWQQMPPAEKQVSHHKFLKCDPHKPYGAYLVCEQGKVKRKDDK